MSLMSLLKLIDKYFEPVFIVAGTALITLIIFFQIVLRFFDNPISWAEELARYLFVWVIYLSISYGIKEDRHIRITAAIHLLPRLGKLMCLVFSDVIFMIYSILVVYYGGKIIDRSLMLGQISSGLEVPIAILYGSIVIGGTLNVIRLIQRIKKRLKESGNNSSSSGVAQ